MGALDWTVMAACQVCIKHPHHATGCRLPYNAVGLHLKAITIFTLIPINLLEGCPLLGPSPILKSLGSANCPSLQPL